MRRFARTVSSTPSAVLERLQQILDEKLHSATSSALANDPALAKALGTDPAQASFTAAKRSLDLAGTEFKEKYRSEIAYEQSSKYLNVDDRLASEKIWTGSESMQTVATRMILDSMPPPKQIKRKKTIISPPVPTNTRMRNAKEHSLDYKVSKALTPEEEEKRQFTELYKERLLGPSMFFDATSSKATLGLVTSMADARINATINRKTGKFDSDEMHSVRGKPLDRDRLANSSNLAFFINEILINQDCLPPWIENQQGIDREVAQFRHELRKSLAKLIKDYYNNQDVLDSKEYHALVQKTDPEALLRHCSASYRAQRGRYLEAKIAELNRGIRSYNLQCPSSSLHKWKLMADNELRQQCMAVVNNLDAYQNELHDTRPPAPKPQTNFLGLFDGASNVALRYPESQKPAGGLQFWSLVRNIFK